MGSRHRDRSRSRSRSRHRERDRGRDRDREKERHRSKRSRRDRSKERKSKERRRSKDRDRDRRSRSRSRSHSRSTRSRSRDRERRSKDRDGTLAMLDSMVGTHTTSTANSARASSLAGRVAQAALLAAQVAQKVHQPLPIVITSLIPNTTIHHIGVQKQIFTHDDDSNHSNESLEDKRRRKRSRWAGSEHEKTFIPGLPTILPATLTKEQEEQYLLQLQIEEVSRKLRSGDLGIPGNPEERSPSPEPIYSSDGKRLNMREYRVRRKLEEDRHALVQRMLVLNPEYKPPTDYKPPIIRVHDKVMIPQEQHPDLNFVGLLIGPRGNTLKSMEKETGAKIIIRGKGSVKEGKVGRKDGQPLPGEDEPLHAYITATNPECVKKAVDKIKEVIRQGVEVPEGQNDLRRMQLRELAQLNGTLREGDARSRCNNCGATDHKTWTCPDKPNVTNNIVCSACGGAGHIAGDCRSKRPGLGGPPPAANRAKIDEEYLSLMAELGEGPPPSQENKSGPRRTNFSNPFDMNRAPPRAIMAAPPPPSPHMIPPSLPPPPAYNNAAPPPPFPPPPPPPPGAPNWMSNQPPPPGSSAPAPPPSVPPPNIPSLMNGPPGYPVMMNRQMPPPGMGPPPMLPPGPPNMNTAPPSIPPPGMPPPPNMGPQGQQNHNMNMSGQNNLNDGGKPPSLMSFNMAPPGMAVPPPNMGWGRPPYPPPPPQQQQWGGVPPPPLLQAPPPPPPPS